MSTLPDWNNDAEQWLTAQNIEAEKLLSNPLLQKDVWRTIEDLKLNINQHQKVVTITFKHIKPDWLKLLTKLYILLRSQRKYSPLYLRNDVGYITRFSQFISSKSIFTAEQIDNQLFEEYDYYLRSLKNQRTKKPLSQRSISLHYMTLINFFNLCRQ